MPFYFGVKPERRILITGSRIRCKIDWIRNTAKRDAERWVIMNGFKLLDFKKAFDYFMNLILIYATFF